MDSSDGKGSTPDDLPLSHICYSYIEGFTAGQQLYAAKDCTLPKVTMGTLIRLYVTYMEKNPKLMDAQKEAGMYLAINDSFPCQKGK